MWKAIGGAVAATYVVYQMATLFYAGTLFGVILPAEQRCESEAMKAALDMQRNPYSDGSSFDRVMKTCQGAAAMASAFVPGGTKP
ncbi:MULTISPECIES: hypothetical protein [Paraburkholderia]|uniref:hypothetical protein n=1 Tax=Paraburkholderia TaxID=1822464 RepID=UPI00129088B8|nr:MULTISPECIES: hypothetical protein [Paraburkholderia]MDR7006061.1 hypothetical protein [Paraburkholderia strydomiana]